MYVFGKQIDRQQKQIGERERGKKPLQEHTIVKERIVFSVFVFKHTVYKRKDIVMLDAIRDECSSRKKERKKE